MLTNKDVFIVKSPEEETRLRALGSELVAEELASVPVTIRKHLHSAVGLTNQVVAHIFDGHTGKLMRPKAVLLMALATSLTPGAEPPAFDYTAMDKPLSAQTNEYLTDPVADYPPEYYMPRDKGSNGTILPTQLRVAEILEMIHNATLIQDDVIDESPTRRGKPTVHTVFSNKVAVLLGDYIYARASVLLARLHNVHVTETMSMFVKYLVDGELLQMSNVPPSEESGSSATGDFTFDELYGHYLKKTFAKTASVFAHCFKAVALLGGCTDETIQLVFNVGCNMGMAFQLADDLLDLTGYEDDVGKPVGADLEEGLATAPVLFAMQEHPELYPMIVRRFSKNGDVKRALDLILNSRGIAKTFEAAEEFVQKAVDGLMELPDSPAREALIGISRSFITRVYVRN
ncbi:terpenoid synthase [Ramicandelaber brevisporus]|nr:terpenoid synthase [Ramicandelaber brevisporus]